MEIERAIEIIKNPTKIGISLEERMAADNMAIEALNRLGDCNKCSLDMIDMFKEKMERYAWHNLLLDPEDLPTKDYKYLLVKSKYGSYSLTSYADGFNCNRRWTGEVIKDYEFKNIIAWKEFELLEEE